MYMCVRTNLNHQMSIFLLLEVGRMDLFLKCIFQLHFVHLHFGWLHEFSCSTVMQLCLGLCHSFLFSLPNVLFRLFVVLKVLLSCIWTILCSGALCTLHAWLNYDRLWFVINLVLLPQPLFLCMTNLCTWNVL